MEDSAVYTIDDDFTIDVVEDDGDYESEKVEIDPSDETVPDLDVQPQVFAKAAGKSRKCPLYKCHMCGYRSSNPRSAVSHIKMHSDPRKPRLLKCRNCDYETFTKSALSFHMARCISDDMKIKCPHCDFFTIKHRNLKTHLNRHNMPGKPYHCRSCGFKSEELGAFEDHMLREHEIKKVRCEFCDFTTTSRKVLKRHQAAHQQVTKVKIYKCDMCDYESKFARNVIRHRSKHILLAQITTK